MKIFNSKLYIKLLLITLCIITCVMIPLDANNTTNYKSVFNNNTNDFNVLVINSYNSSSEWEHFVFQGIENKLDDYPNIKINREYLDSRQRLDEEYLKGFLELLNLKYSNKKIDTILVIDDEAFNLARKNLFNSNSIFYKTPIVFTGVNKVLNLTKEEKNYITGVVQIENNLQLINMILDIHKDITKINIILDNATYSNVVKENIESVKMYFKRPIEINYLQHTYIEDILNELSKDSTSYEGNIIVGDFKSLNGDDIYPLKETIKLIKNTISTPIYTKSQPYVFTGIVGGIVDLGQTHGNVLGDIIIKLSEGESVSNLNLIYDSLEKVVFDYNSLDEYNINPLLLPENSLFINKGAFDFLLPTSVKVFIWSTLITFCIFIIVLIYKLFLHKRESLKNKKLYLNAQEAERLKTEFISTVSHELRTPINIILNTSKLLSLKSENGNIDKVYLNEKLSYIDQNSQRLLRLVNNILDLTKIQSGFMEAHFEMSNIVEIIENTVLSIVDFAKSHNIEVLFDTEEEEIITAVDEPKLERTLLNLLSNSIKFTPSNGNIIVMVRRDANKVFIDIKDTGIGISEDYLPYIFDKFKQVDSSLTRFNEGSGLGLSIVKGLVTIQDGTISVASKPNVGTIFTLTFPITKIDNVTSSSPIKHSNLDEIVKIELSDIKDKED